MLRAVKGGKKRLCRIVEYMPFLEYINDVGTGENSMRGQERHCFPSSLVLISYFGLLLKYLLALVMKLGRICT